MKKRRFKLVFGKSPGTILNVDKFKSLQGKMPSDVDIMRRLCIWEQTKTEDPYYVYLNKEESELFQEEFLQKAPHVRISKNIYIQDSSKLIVKIQTT